MFALAHLPFWGTVRIVDTTFFAVVMTVLFLRRGNLTACIAVHATVNALTFVPEIFVALAWIAVVAGPLLMIADAVVRPVSRYPSGGKTLWLTAFAGATFAAGPVLTVPVAGAYWLKVRRHGGPARVPRPPSGPFVVTFEHAAA